MPDPRAVLITMPHSHYAEKARWALDWLALPYREERHVPLLHRLATTRRGGGSVPLMLHGDADPLVEHCDSAHGPGTREIQAEQVSDSLDRENPYHVVAYKGAHHGFDNAGDGSGTPVDGGDEESAYNGPEDVAARDAALTVALKRLSTYL